MVSYQIFCKHKYITKNPAYRRPLNLSACSDRSISTKKYDNFFIRKNVNVVLVRVGFGPTGLVGSRSGWVELSLTGWVWSDGFSWVGFGFVRLVGLRPLGWVGLGRQIG